MSTTRPEERVDTVVLDIDGTLVDTNYHHALAWARAFAACDRDVPVWRIHRSIGMGGDRLVPHLLGEDDAEEIGDDVRDQWETEVAKVIEETRLLPQAGELIRRLADADVRVVLASSGKQEHVERALDLLRKEVDVEDAIDHLTSSADAPTKPAPDLIDKAVEEAGGSVGLVIGDSVWDARAARRAQMPMVGLLTGGFGEAELRDAGAELVAEDIGVLLDVLEDLLGIGAEARS